MEMKKVLFKGTEYLVPDWAKFIAKDKDGSVYVYEHEPRFNEVTENYAITSGECLEVGNENMMEILS